MTEALVERRVTSQADGRREEESAMKQIIKPYIEIFTAFRWRCLTSDPGCFSAASSTVTRLQEPGDITAEVSDS